MKLTYDPRHNTAYLRLQEKVGEVETLRLSDEVNMDIAPDESVYGIELLNANEQLKERHELAVAGRLLDKLGIAGPFSLETARPPQPDVRFNAEGKTVGIEVATAYYSNEHARFEWKEQEQSVSLSQPDHSICEFIQKEICDKCSMLYQGADELWLCIDVKAVGDRASMNTCVERLSIPKEHHFHRIYLLHWAPAVAGAAGTEQGGYDKTAELYPRKGPWF